MNLDYDDICILLSQPKQLQLPKSNSLISERTMSILIQATLSICYLKITFFFILIQIQTSIWRKIQSSIGRKETKMSRSTYSGKDSHLSCHHNDSLRRRPSLGECIVLEMHTKMTGRRVLWKKIRTI